MSCHADQIHRRGRRQVEAPDGLGGAGDGVLFLDADGDGTLSQKREYVFTEAAEPAAVKHLHF